MGKIILLRPVFSVTKTVIEGKSHLPLTNIGSKYKGDLNEGNGIPKSYNILFVSQP